jgi:hypothetical protein
MFMLQPWMEHSNRLDQVMSRQPPLPLPERIRIIRRIANAVRVYHVKDFPGQPKCPPVMFSRLRTLQFGGKAALVIA